MRVKKELFRKKKVYSQNAVFSFDKGLNCQNHSSSGFHHMVKIPTQQNIQSPSHWEEIYHPWPLFGKPWNRHGGGVIIYIHDDIHSKQLAKHKLPDDMEDIEMNLRKTRWLIIITAIFGTYRPPSQPVEYFLNM